jgi:hypothetical protein
MWVDWLMDRLAALEEGLQEEADAIEQVRCWPAGCGQGVGTGCAGGQCQQDSTRAFPFLATSLSPPLLPLCVCVQFVTGALDKSNADIASSYAALGVDKLLLSNPTVDNPRNVLDVMLQSRMYTVSLGCEQRVSARL